MKLSQQEKFEKFGIKLCKKHDLDEQTIDFESIYDNGITLAENKDLLEQRIKEMSRTADIDITESIEKYREAMKEQLETIRQDEYVNDDHYKLLKEYVRMSQKGFITSLFLIGKHGIGKSYNIINELENNKEKYPYVYRVGKITPLALYKLLYEHNNQTFFFDDTQSLIKDNDSLSILMACLWSATGKRIVSWNSTKLDGYPPEFEFTGRIIFCLNEIPENEIIKTLLSRCVKYEFRMNREQIIDVMNKISEIPTDLQIQTRKEIVNYIIENTDETTEDFDLRLQQKIESIYRYNKENWKELSKPLFKQDNILKALKYALTYNKPSKQIAIFYEETGLGKSQFYNYKRKLGYV